MTMASHELLQRLSATLRQEIAPAVDGEYTRTQAYMASVILERLAKQLALAPDHDQAEQGDVSVLIDKLRLTLPDADADADADVMAAVEALTRARTVAALGPLIEALYHWGIERPEAAAALALIRPVLRRDIDRRVEVAR